MIYKMEDILLMEILVYMVDIPPLKYILNAKDKTIGEFLDEIELDKLEDDRVYATAMTGRDFRNIILAMKKRPHILEAYIADTHLDEAYGGGGGISAVFRNDSEMEAVVAFRGTASNEWTDDFVGANQIDSLQQINALEWYKKVYEKYNLKDYFVTVTGHSKGGNKAKYITILNDTPDRCISFDGQGFSDKFVEHYKKRIAKRQGIIENHNIDYDYVNILMNDIGKRTFYIGFNYGPRGFIEAHSPKTFFEYGEEGEFKLKINPNGQKAEMQILDQFINSMIRSGVSESEKDETDELVGMLVEKAFAIGEEHTVSSYISFLCDMVGDSKYADNTAYLLAFIIRYSKMNEDFLGALKGIMSSFKADHIVKIIDIFDELINSKKLSALISVSNFLIMHVNVVVVRRIQAIARKHEVELTDEQVRGVLQIICMTKDMLKTLELEMDGSDYVIEDEEGPEEEEIELPSDLDIVVLAGGLSNERNISLKTGYMLSEALKKKGHRVILLDAFMGYGDRGEIITDPFDNTEKYSLPMRKISDDLPDLWAVKKRRMDQSNSYFGPNVLQICKDSDIVFIALHGASGENGKVQAAFDLLGIDYTGCDYFSSAVTSNKAVAKKLIADAGIEVPMGYCVYRNSEIPLPDEMGLSYPVIVKPNNGGIGIGISVASDEVAYRKAIREAFGWDSEILVEEYIPGREIKVGTIAGKALPVLEVPPLHGGHGNEGMNLRGEKLKKCPADISPDLSEALKEAAERVTAALGALAYSKVDFILKDDDTFVCLECDSLPQLYPDSDIVVEAEAYGYSYEEFCDKIMKLSFVNKTSLNN